MSLKNKKGFTLLEMMIVIAVIAILVAVIIPIVNGSTDKASAATNAANLRSVEGEIVSMMLLNPAAFGDQAGKKADIDQARQESNQTTEDAKKAIDEAAAKVDAAQVAYDAQKAITDSFPHPETYYIGLEAEYNGHLTCNYKFSWSSLSLEHQSCSEQHLQVETEYKEYENIYKPELQKLVALGTELATAKAALEYADEAKTAIDEANKVAQDGFNVAENLIYTLIATNGQVTLDDGTVITAPVSKKVNKDGVTIAADIPMTIYVNTLERTAYAVYSDLTNTYDASDFSVAAE